MDSLYRYNLSDMESKVRDILGATNTTIDPTAGDEATSTIVYQNISNQMIDSQINESLVALYTEAMLGNDELFAIDVYQDVVENVVQYAFPQNMLMLRNMNWKRPHQPPPTLNTPPGIAPQTGPWDYEPMVEISDPMDKSIARGWFNAPTYRRNSDNYILSILPHQPNPAGIRLNVVVLPAPLVQPPATPNVIQGLFARLAQEVVIYDAAIKLADYRKLQISPNATKLRDEWHTRYFAAIENAIKQQSTNLVSTRMIARTYSGRWNRVNFTRGW